MKRLLITLAAIFGLTLVPVAAQTSYAIDLFPDSTCSGQVDCRVVKTNDSQLAKNVQSIINLALLVLGGVAVIMIVVGALRMIAANGDPGNIKSGRLTIMWSVVGVVVVLSASAIVNFVVSWDWLK